MAVTARIPQAGRSVFGVMVWLFLDVDERDMGKIGLSSMSRPRSEHRQRRDTGASMPRVHIGLGGTKQRYPGANREHVSMC
jgi:hypothetical protein